MELRAFKNSHTQIKVGYLLGMDSSEGHRFPHRVGYPTD